MFTHSVYFWLKKDLSSADQEKFADLLSKVAEIPALKASWGKPSDTERPVIDRSYTYGLALIFEDRAQHDAYQIHEDHQKFLKECAPLWDKVVIYDFD